VEEGHSQDYSLRSTDASANAEAKGTGVACPPTPGHPSGLLAHPGGGFAERDHLVENHDTPSSGLQS
jgi:hypothetical protein